MCCWALLYVHSSIAIILMGKRELIALLNLSSWCLVVVVWLFLALPWVCLQFEIVVFPDHTHLLFLFLIKHSILLTSCIKISKQYRITYYYYEYYTKYSFFNLKGSKSEVIKIGIRAQKHMF